MIYDLEEKFHSIFHIMHSILSNNYSEPNKKSAANDGQNQTGIEFLYLILLQLIVGLEAMQSNLESMKSDLNVLYGKSEK